MKSFNNRLSSRTMSVGLLPYSSRASIKKQMHPLTAVYRPSSVKASISSTIVQPSEVQYSLFINVVPMGNIPNMADRSSCNILGSKPLKDFGAG